MRNEYLLEIIEILENIERLKKELSRDIGADIKRDIEIIDEMCFDINFLKDLIKNGRSR